MIMLSMLCLMGRHDPATLSSRVAPASNRLQAGRSPAGTAYNPLEDLRDTPGDLGEAPLRRVDLVGPPILVVGSGRESLEPP